MTSVRKLMDEYASRCSDDELFDTLKLQEEYEDSEANNHMKEALREEIARRGLKNGGNL